jgi:hypothetical protein
MALLFAWLGGGAFVGSLAYFVFTYLVTLGQPGASGGRGAAAAALADCLLFLVFATHHSLLARPWAKRWLAQIVPAALVRSVYVWTASALLILACAAWQPLPGTLYRHTGAVALLHLLPVVAGIAFIALAARRLAPLSLAGIAQVRARGPVRTPEPLVTGFPYNVVRHPIYLGWCLVVFGVPTMTWSRLLMACLSTAYLVAAVPWEERVLVGGFGAAYQAYRRRVRWRILPGIY